MRTPTGAWSRKAVALVAVLVAAMAGVSGCTTLRATVGAYDTGPHGIARPQQRLREALIRADFSEALAWREDDALLRQLTMGVSAYYASQFARSAAILDSAALLADDRITTSLSRTAVSLVTNDMARAYQPRRTERLFIPYFGMLAYARQDEWEDAAVEARRLAALLGEHAADSDSAEAATHAMLHYLTGVVFERAGERDEAQVAYRLAGIGQASPRLARGPSAATEGEVVVIVERGFVAHRTTETIDVRFRDDDERHDSALVTRPRGHGRHHDDEHDDDDGYWLSVAFPAVRRAPRISSGAGLLVEGAPAEVVRLDAVLDDAVSIDERRERVAILTRAAARAAAKYAITKAVKDRKGETAGTLANIGAALLERADVRSWHLLPQDIQVLRTRLPAGMQHVFVSLGQGLEPIDVGPVTVKAGQVTLATVRVWREPSPRAVALR